MINCNVKPVIQCALSRRHPQTVGNDFQQAAGFLSLTVTKIQSFHMQALRRILGIRWYDKVSNAVINERTKLLLLLTDVIHYLVTSVAYRRTHLLSRHCNCQ